MSKIYSNVPIAKKLTFSKLLLSKSKKFVSKSSFGELQLISVILILKGIMF